MTLTCFLLFLYTQIFLSCRTACYNELKEGRGFRTHIPPADCYRNPDVPEFTALVAYHIDSIHIGKGFRLVNGWFLHSSVYMILVQLM